MQRRFDIGTKFTNKRGRKYPVEQVVIDYLITTNSQGEVVQIRYVCAHYIMGQPVIDRDVTDTTIARALFDEHGEDWVTFRRTDSEAL